ncbi:MAG: TonB-dependent receptor, partial [Pseudomonadota bacterium]
SSATWTLGSNFYDQESNPFPFGRASWSVQRGAFDTTLSARANRYRGVSINNERVIDPSGMVLETRDEVFDEDGWNGSIALQTRYSFPKTAVQLNAIIDAFDEQGGETSRRQPLGEEAFVLFQGDTDEETGYEIGIDLEQQLGENVALKLIALNRSDDFLETGTLEQPELDRTNQTTRFRSRSRESIARSELAWEANEQHQFGFALEATENRLTSDFTLQQRVGDTLEPVDVPGALTRVLENRYDAAMNYATRVGNWSLDMEAAVERSTIKQTGDFSENRTFEFFKPAITVTYSPTQTLQVRLDSRRVVGQLNFNDFVSAADLGDQELALGNPNLAPESSWETEVVLEQRFGELGLLSLTLFYDQIKDVVDQLPLSDGLEVPGNIGDGSRTGIRTNVTLPLGPIGIKGGRIDLTGRWQRSSVDDPLTGESRELSDERSWEGNIAFRQDLPDQGLAWGGDVSVFAEQPRFGLDELDRFDTDPDLDAFIEKRLTGGLVVRMGIENILENGTNRNRTVFAGRRDSSSVRFIEDRSGAGVRQVFLQISGTL